MKEGDLLLARIQQADGQSKLRPVLALRIMPPHGDWLVCGVSSQLHQEATGFDHVVTASDADFLATGLKTSSVIRLGFLATLPVSVVSGRLGQIAPSLLKELRHRLAAHLEK
jgi:mRNA interferase MazF